MNFSNPPKKKCYATVYGRRVPPILDSMIFLPVAVKDVTNKKANFKFDISVSFSRKHMIEEERLHMLKEHASKLIDYLPPGVLREDDLPHLGSEIIERYGHGHFKH
jgi:hypothetical protein